MLERSTPWVSPWISQAVELLSSSDSRICSCQKKKKREIVKGPGFVGFFSCQAKNLLYSGEVLPVQNEVNPSFIFVMLIQ